MLDSAIPVTVVTGFLGAGKSTLVQRWIGERPRDETAVIVNERGEAGIDGELLAAHVARLREITGGCVCCSSQAELLSALGDFAQSLPRPRRVLIETSGAASPSGVIRAMGTERVRERFRLDGVVTVVDVVRAEQSLGFDLAVEQLAFADVVVLSHVDEATGSPVPIDVDAVQEVVVRHAPAAVVARARRGVLASTLLELLGQRTEALHVHPKGSGHSVIEAVSLVHGGELDEQRFGEWVENALGRVGARILRLKGILAMNGLDVRVIVQGVGEGVEVQLGSPWGNAERTSRLVVLGLGLDAAELEAGFLQCGATAPALE